MKLSCLPVSYFDKIISEQMSVAQWSYQASDLGFDAIDLSVLFFKNHDQEYLKKIRESIEATGIKVAVLNTYPDFTNPDPMIRKEEQAKLKKYIVSASVLNAEMMRVTAGQAHPQISRKEGVKWAIEGLLSSMAFAENYGIKILYENHSKPGIWDYPDFSHPSNIFLEIVNAIRDTQIGILFDTANPLAYGDEPLPLLEKVIDKVVCIHAADTKIKGRLAPAVIGNGVVPFEEIFMMLNHSGYDGWISIEEASGTGRAGVASAVDFVRMVWEKTFGRNKL